MFFSGETLGPIEEETAGFCETAESLKQEVALSLLRPDLKFLRILMSKIRRPCDQEMLQADLAISVEANDISHQSIIHFLQCFLAYIFCDFETAAKEATKFETILQLPYIHPGFSCLVTFHALAFLAVAPNHFGLARKKILKGARRSLRILEHFARTAVPENCLQSLNLVQAELESLNQNCNVARGKYVVAIAVAIKAKNMMMHALACERFALFLRKIGDESGALENFQEAYSAYRSWGAFAKAELLEKEIGGTFSSIETAKRLQQEQPTANVSAN